MKKLTKPQTVKENEAPESINIKRKIGTTTYMVNAYFNKDAAGDMVSKVKNLITR